MHLIKPQESTRLALDNMFSVKYPWLLRWALHFAQNDRSVAEDLVQETFIRILGIRGTLVNLDEIEPLLYTHLRFAYLTERRRALSHAFQELSTVDFDTLAISLRTSSSFNQIEVQNELRKILAFLLWRRRSAKFASIFLLRFFHGFSPEEIAGICLITRRAVDLSLLHTREELRAYLAHPSRLQVLRRGPTPEFVPLNIAVTSDDFINELLGSIFGSSCGSCQSDAALERRYCALNPRPLDSDLVAHLVSCKPCLDKAARFCGTSLPPARSMEDSLKPVRRAVKSKRSEPTEKEILARIFARGEQRMRERFEHRPSGLVIALNAEVVAVRDISSPRAVLKVETRSTETLDMVEVFSEQGMLMMALPVLLHPPQSPPELSQEIALSDDRTLSLIVCFTADGALIEATYLDPHFILDTADEEAEDNYALTMMESEDEEIMRGRGTSGGLAKVTKLQRVRAWWPRLFVRIFELLRSRPFVPVAAMVFLLVGALSWFTANHQREQTQATNFLNESVRAERNRRIAHGPGVVRQRLSIRTAKGTIQRDIYRDIDNRRRPKAHLMDNDERLLMAKMEEAGLEWDNPLSVAAFQSWRDHEPGEQDHIEKSGADFMTVTTTLPSGSVARESLTLRMKDLHLIARTVYFRDAETVEVAELSYEYLPWEAASEKWFEPTVDAQSIASPRRSTSLPPPGPERLSEANTDIARLSVLLALQQMQAETERIQVTQTARGIAVTGIVDSESRKHEIADRLRMIPHVTTNILSYRDFDDKRAGVDGITAIKAISVVAGRSSLDNYCEVAVVRKERCQQLAFLLLNSSATMVREGSRLCDLQRQYPATKTLTPAARILLNKLMQQHADHLVTAAGEQEKAFATLGLEPPRAANTAASYETKISDIVQHNLFLAKELVYAENERSRSALFILHEMAMSAEEARLAAARVSDPAVDRTAISSTSSTSHHD
jgi:DNA-directed RNA polymerase specialized sigma24 family protein